MVKEDLRCERIYLKDILENCGYLCFIFILVEGDGCYNNLLYWFWDRNLFQFVIQSIYIISENVIFDKKIIGVIVKNKFCCKCIKGSRCLEYLGKCLVFLIMDVFIGCEYFVIEEICYDFFIDREFIFISYMIIDGDSVVFCGVQKVMREYGQIVEVLRDIWYFVQFQKKVVDNVKFSQNMFFGRIVIERQVIKRKFLVDLMKRCIVEYDIVQKKFCGDLEKLIYILSFVIDVIVECYLGCCGGICIEYLFVCSGLFIDCWLKEYLLLNLRIFNFILEDEEIICCFVDFWFSRSIIIII